MMRLHCFYTSVKDKNRQIFRTDDDFFSFVFIELLERLVPSLLVH